MWDVHRTAGPLRQRRATSSPTWGSHCVPKVTDADLFAIVRLIEDGATYAAVGCRPSALRMAKRADPAVAKRLRQSVPSPLRLVESMPRRFRQQKELREASRPTCRVGVTVNLAQRKLLLSTLAVVAVGMHLWFCRWGCDLGGSPLLQIWRHVPTIEYDAKSAFAKFVSEQSAWLLSVERKPVAQPMAVQQQPAQVPWFEEERQRFEEERQRRSVPAPQGNIGFDEEAYRLRVRGELAAEAIQRDRDLATSFRLSMQEDPEVQADAQRIAKQLGIAPDLASQNLDVAKALVKEQAMKLNEMRTRSPVLWGMLDKAPFQPGWRFGLWQAPGRSDDEAWIGGVFAPLGIVLLCCFLVLGWRGTRSAGHPKAGE